MTRKAHSDDSPGEYSVGYGRPPVASRFKPGESGNKRGRPTAKKTVGQTIEEALARLYTVNESGRVSKITAEALIFRNLVAGAARGDPRLIRILFDFRKQYQNGRETRLDLAGLAAEDRSILDAFLAEASGKAANQDDASSTSNQLTPVRPEEA